MKAAYGFFSYSIIEPDLIMSFRSRAQVASVRSSSCIIFFRVIIISMVSIYRDEQSENYQKTNLIMSRINSHALPTQKMEPIKGSIFTLPPALSLKQGTYFQKQTFLFDFFGVFVITQIMDFSWGYPLHNHHSAKEKKCRITKEFQ